MLANSLRDLQPNLHIHFSENVYHYAIPNTKTYTYLGIRENICEIISLPEIIPGSPGKVHLRIIYSSGTHPLSANAYISRFPKTIFSKSCKILK